MPKHNINVYVNSHWFIKLYWDFVPNLGEYITLRTIGNVKVETIIWEDEHNCHLYASKQGDNNAANP